MPAPGSAEFSDTTRFERALSGGWRRRLGRRARLALLHPDDVTLRPAACDVEGFGLVFLEANACGKPVIGGRTGGIPEAIVDGKTGFLVEPERVADIAERLGTVLADRELAAEMGRQGRTRVKAHFLWADAAAQIQELVTVMVVRTAPPP